MIVWGSGRDGRERGVRGTTKAALGSLYDDDDDDVGGGDTNDFSGRCRSPSQGHVATLRVPAVTNIRITEFTRRL